jgi:hypothetical protein
VISLTKQGYHLISSKACWMPISEVNQNLVNGSCVPKLAYLISRWNGSYLEAVIHFQSSNCCLVP